MFKRIWRARVVQEAIGSLLAGYLTLVKRTNRLILDSPDSYERFASLEPVIMAMWHGQHFMIPIGRQPDQRYSVLISRHGDGEMNAIAVNKLGISLVRGVGAGLHRVPATLPACRSRCRFAAGRHVSTPRVEFV